MPLRPWSPIPIRDNGEPLQELPPALLRLEPHPYASLGAPYGTGSGPFRLRRGVIERLLQAQASLRQERGDWRLAIFDAWRPLAVQRFMVRNAFVQECRRRGLHPDLTGAGQREVEELVGRFWAPPSVDPATPPPHSTGGAVDLTLADREGRPLAMGGEIDDLGPISEPHHHAAAAAERPDSQEAQWHGRRRLLAHCLEAAGFAQHPNEWWHFSHGDQLWAWRSGQPEARYGRCPEAGEADDGGPAAGSAS
jgi:D-alanyl-D-alanine dipeptidase